MMINCADCLYYRVRMNALPCCEYAAGGYHQPNVHFQPKDSRVVEVEADVVRTRLVERVEDGFVRTSIVRSLAFDPEAAWKATKLAAGDIT
jgi:hypothetical protein